MRNILKKTLGRGSEDQKGFTLIELLVVTGIIVALAAIIVPLVISFSGEGEQAAQAGERETIQTSIQSMMVKHSLKTVTESLTTNTNGEKINSTGTQFSTAADINLESFMDQASTMFCYKWGSDGRVTQQNDVTDAGSCATTVLFPAS
ncbi:MAG: type II secretion system protein [Chloroflexi bacterium]|nr:type II secretion system protein [Chloroflexota bacterium]